MQLDYFDGGPVSDLPRFSLYQPLYLNCHPGALTGMSNSRTAARVRWRKLTPSGRSAEPNECKTLVPSSPRPSPIANYVAIQAPW